MNWYVATWMSVGLHRIQRKGNTYVCSKHVWPNPRLFVHVFTSIYIKLRTGYYWWLQLESITINSFWLLLHVCKLLLQQRRTWLLPSAIHLLNCPIPVYTMNCFKIIPAVTPIHFSDPKDIHLVVARVESLTACFPSCFLCLHPSVHIHLPTSSAYIDVSFIYPLNLFIDLRDT